MTSDTDTRTRRSVLRSTAGAAALVAGASGAATAQESTSARPDWGGWLEGVDGGFRDARGQSEVTVLVGADGNNGSFAFAPAGLWVDPGTTVKWEWTGEGGGHNVVAQSGPADLDSGQPVADAGVHYEYTFEAGGITTYYCAPHRSLGMKGAVAVGGEVPTVTPGGGSSQQWTPPGGDAGLLFVLLVLGSAGVAAVSVLAGDVYGSIRERAGEPSRAGVTAGVAVALGLLFVVAIVAQLVIAG